MNLTDTFKDAAEAVATGQHVTKHAIQLSDVENWLTASDLARRDSKGGWVGTLPDLIDDSGSDISNGLDKFFGILSGRKQMLDTQKPAIALQVGNVVSGLLALGHLTQDQVDYFYSLGSNRPHLGRDLQADWDSHQTQTAYKAEFARIMNDLSAAHDADSLKQALTTAKASL